MVLALAKFMTRYQSVLFRACGLVWSMLVALGAIDPGSNPGRPTTSLHSWTNASRPVAHSIIMEFRGLAKLEIFAILTFFFGSLLWAIIF